jgi:hypothetical protein
MPNVASKVRDKIFLKGTVIMFTDTVSAPKGAFCDMADVDG